MTDPEDQRWLAATAGEADVHSDRVGPARVGRGRERQSA